MSREFKIAVKKALIEVLEDEYEEDFWAYSLRDAITEVVAKEFGLTPKDADGEVQKRRKET